MALVAARRRLVAVVVVVGVDGYRSAVVRLFLASAAVPRSPHCVHARAHRCCVGWKSAAFNYAPETTSKALICACITIRANFRCMHHCYGQACVLRTTNSAVRRVALQYGKHIPGIDALTT